ncbi:UDP-N-acetylmuramoyl-L-alanyl-D-glutamate--2,6-diaminopimelate ligase [Verrucomicrobiota bacterium]
MKTSELIKEIETVAVEGSPEHKVSGLACDSRRVRPGYVFVAVKGRNYDGTLFINDAVKRGAVGVVFDSELSVNGGREKSNVCYVRVKDARTAFGKLACAFNDKPSQNLQLIGITGTNGKTTTSYMVRDILKADGRNPGLIGTVEYEIGSRVIPANRTTPEASELQAMLAQMVKGGCKSAVMEVSSHALIQKRTVGVDFDVGVFTNLTRDHLDYHGTFEQYFEAKTLLFKTLGKQEKRATAVINTDDPWGQRLLAMNGIDAEILTCGMNSEAMIRSEDIKLGSGGSSYRAITPWGNVDINLNLLGRFNISNSLAAIASCGALGVDLKTINNACSGIVSVSGRLEEIKGVKDFQVFVDYAHTDDALEHVLETLREITEARLIVVFGCGGDRDKSKRSAMGQVASRLADYSIVTSDNPRKENSSEIIEQICHGFNERKNFEIIEDRKEAINTALTMAGKGDVVLIAGKGHENFQEFGDRTIPFDDRQIVREIINDN